MVPTVSRRSVGTARTITQLTREARRRDAVGPVIKANVSIAPAASASAIATMTGNKKVMSRRQTPMASARSASSVAKRNGRKRRDREIKIQE
jgi:hypothetical protein